MFSAFLILVVAMFSIQAGAGFAKTLFPIVGPFGATNLRLFFASVILIILWRPWRKIPQKQEFLPLALYGGSLGLMNLCFYLALEKIPLGLAVTLEFCGPLCLSLILSKKLSDILWASLATLGVILIYPENSQINSTNTVGIFFALAAGFFWALYIYFGQKTPKDMSHTLVTCWGMIFAFLISFPFGVGHFNIQSLNFEIIPFAIGVAILSSALPYSLEMIALRKIPAKTFGILVSLEPAFATLFGWIILNEMMSGVQMMAMMMIMMASMGSALGFKKINF
jgi:inner membrane transporter RhtA